MINFLTKALLVVLGVLILTSACSKSAGDPALKREEMVKTQIEGRGISSPLILKAMREIPREEFVLPKYADRAYEDNEIPFGFGETMDRPFENATMVEALKIEPDDSVLEIGTGSGYLTSLISKLAKKIYSIEIEPQIADNARKVIEKLGYKNIHLKTGDGFVGWPEHQPFDEIILMCSPDEIPKPLIGQLAEGGRLLLPLGGTKKFQELILFEKKNGKLIEIRRLAPTVFTPMKGKVLEKN